MRDLYNAENQLLKAIPKMAKAATSEDLRNAFLEHLEQTKEQVTRLEQIFEALGEPARGKTCKAMKGLIEEGKDVIEAEGSDEVRDAALIAAAQRVEHYEMASYGCLNSWAQLLGEEDAAALFEETLNEEKATDEKLTQVAESAINPEEKEEEEPEHAGRSSASRRR